MLLPPPELSPARVDLWLLPTKVSTEQMSYLQSLLPLEETERFSRFRMAAKRDEAIISRGLLRHVLSFVLGQSTREIVFTLGAKGKPGIDHSRVRFNVSHTAGRVLLAVTLDHEIGVDIEQIRTRTSYEDLARRFFTAEEYGAIMMLPPAERLRAFFICWTRKEAILKGTGEGISAGLASFEVPICPLSGSALVAGRWHLQELDVGKSFVAALASAFQAEIRWNPVE